MHCSWRYGRYLRERSGEFASVCPGAAKGLTDFGSQYRDVVLFPALNLVKVSYLFMYPDVTKTSSILSYLI